jgi:hypothetical protein
MIRLADPKEDRARPESIAMIAVAAWGVGFALMLGVAKLMPKYSALQPSTLITARAQLPLDSPAPTRAISPTRGLEPKAAHIVKPAPLPQPPAARPPQPSAATAETQPLPAPPKPRGAQKRSFRRGVFAYLRCEGSERPHARFPCPRDEKFEESVWRTLEGLTRCDPDPGTGTADVRLVLRGSQVSGIEWKAGTSGQGLNLRAIGKCAGAKLAELRTRLRAPEGLVYFRFSLE